MALLKKIKCSALLYYFSLVYYFNLIFSQLIITGKEYFNGVAENDVTVGLMAEIPRVNFLAVDHFRDVVYNNILGSH